MSSAEFEVPTSGEECEAADYAICQEHQHVPYQKFITSPQAFTMPFQKVLLMERPKNPYVFQLTYEKCFNTALNQKRSTCEQAGFRIVRDTINKDFKK